MMRLKFAIPLGLALAAGCAASDCRPCRAQSPSPQAPDDAAPPRPRAPRFVTPPEEEEQDLPPLPVPSPGTGKVRKTTTTVRETEGAAVYIEQHAAGVIVVGSSGMAVPSVQQAPQQPAMAPLIPLPVPDSLIFAAGRRVAGAGYYLVTGQCPPPRAQRVQFVQAVQEAPQVRYVAAQQAPAVQQFVTPEPVAPSPQAAPKHRWFGR